ncbi:MAG: type III secretion system chaperone [Parachlamydiaceae bacterium]|nr:type III secretion system chaperone [Parachlamydiaceae bacterium]
MLDTFIRQLSKELEFDTPLEASSPGVYEYPLDEELSITISAIQPQGFSLTSLIGPYPKDKEDEFLNLMMTGNLFGKETLGATLGLTYDGQLMTLSRVVSTRVDYREFKAILEDFYHVISCWREQAGQGTHK